MKTRIRIAFTVDATDADLKELAEHAAKMFRSDELTDLHVVAVRQQEVLVEVGHAPAPKDRP